MSTNLSNIKYPHSNPSSTADNTSSSARTRAVLRRTRTNGARATLIGEKQNNVSNSNGKSSADSSSRTYFHRRFLGFRSN